MTTALVTGGAGFIGSSIARELLRQDWEVRIIDNLMAGFREHVPDDAELFEEDLRDLDAVRKATDGVDVIFHQAAIRSVPKSIDNPWLSHDCNVNGTVNLLMAAAEADVRRIVYASSSSVYGDVKNPPNKEDMRPNPMSPYAASKLAAENYCRVWTHVKGLSSVSLRYFNVYGPGQHPESKYSAVFPGFISALKAGRQPEIHWDGEQSRDFCYIGDVVRANIAAATAAGPVDGEIFNVGGGGPKTVNDVYKAVSNVLNVSVEPRYTDKRAGDVRHTRADISKAAELLNWQPQARWEEAVRKTVEWFDTEGADRDVGAAS